MAEDLPDEFDLIVIGTGFSESCIAAAASRIGKTVLHVDPNDYYGGAWASFNLEAFCNRLEASNGENDVLRNASCKWHIDDDGESAMTQPTEQLATEEAASEGAAEKWTKAKVLAQSRRFSLDLSPKILYAAGELVQLLISSNICRYAEFRAVDRVCTRFQERLLSVPCSRSDVFNTKDLNIVEKRLLMKFLTMCVAYGEDKCAEDTALYKGKRFREYLEAQHVTEKISTCIMQAIAMCDEESPFELGMQRTQLFLHSLGRYGNTPFLFPMYGCGEIPQCFCRLCAVFGGIYCLKRRVTELAISADTNVATLVLEEGEQETLQRRTLRTKHVVCSHNNLPASLQQATLGVHGHGALVNHLSRAVFVASSPLGAEDLNTGGGGVNLLRLIAGEREAFLIQLSHYSGTCPKGIFVFHLTTAALSDDPAADLQPFVAQVLGDSTGDGPPPQLLYSAYFTLTACATATAPIDSTTPVFCTAAPYYELDYDRSIQNAREIFGKLYADAEFLPRAPDPEEIVIDGEDPRAFSEVNLPDDLRAQLRELEEAADNMEIENAEGQTGSPAAAAEQSAMDAE